MEIFDISLKDAEAFLAKHERHYKTGAEPLLAIGVSDADGMHGAAILGRSGPGVAELHHIYCDGISQGYTLLYGAIFRAAKGAGYKMIML